MKKLTKREQFELQKDEVRNELMDLMEKHDYTIWTKLEHVSQSGMLRRISCYVKDENDYLKDITNICGMLSGYNEDKNKPGLRVSGCGMDMGFSVVYNTSVATYCKDGYNHDCAYKIKQRWL